MEGSGDTPPLFKDVDIEGKEEDDDLFASAIQVKAAES